jgi:hypothetical protein
MIPNIFLDIFNSFNKQDLNNKPKDYILYSPISV